MCIDNLGTFVATNVEHGHLPGVSLESYSIVLAEIMKLKQRVIELETKLEMEKKKRLEAQDAILKIKEVIENELRR